MLGLQLVFTPPEGNTALYVLTRSVRRDAPESQGVSRGDTTARAVFLHAGWRSGGTWLWSRCRDVPQMHGFYEPLHEVARDLRRGDIARINPGSWQSSHSPTDPYFEEYRPLIPKGGRGIALYQPRFAFDSYFLDPDREDPALAAYMHGLLAVSSAYDHVAVMKFCRSLGRVGWFEQNFPEALHAVVMRNPLKQWRSCRRLLVEQRNRYFTVAPVLVLARHAQHPLVRQACAALDVRLPRLESGDMAYGVEKIWRAQKRQEVAESYRAFLAFWAVTTMTALEGEALVIDNDRLGSDPEHRATVEHALQGYIGNRLKLQPRAPSSGFDHGLAKADIRAAHEAAAAWAVSCADRLAPPRLALLLDALGADGREATLPRTQVQVACPGAAMGISGRARVGAEVLFARALQPVRRLHGTLARTFRV
jgi:hypothetical protein